jgi:hypothetical protein
VSSSTDEIWEGNMRASKVSTRFHVCAPSVGVVDTYSKRTDAFEAAGRHANKNNETTEVFDSMARRGMGDLWEFFPSPDGGLVTWKQPKRRKS